jgi:HEAT repeat protein
MDRMIIDSLFSRTLAGDYDDDAPWEAVHELRNIASREVLQRAVEWCRSETPLKRARGADVLAQIGKTVEHQSNKYPHESYSAVSELAASENEILPLNSAIHALGHIGDPRGVPIIVQHARNNDPELREAVAFACGCFPEEKDALDALLILITDCDEDVRDWATFGVGALFDADSPEIRAALALALRDPHEDVRREAITGLAKRGDVRAFPPLIALFRKSPDDPLALEAAGWLLGYSGDEPEDEPSVTLLALERRFAAMHLASLGGSDPTAKAAPRRRPNLTIQR